MGEFKKLNASAPATLGAVVEAITRLSTYSEAQILKLVSSGKMQEVFPFRPSRAAVIPPDTVEEDDLVEASAMPLSQEAKAALLQSSMPRSRPANSRPGASRGRKAFPKR